MPLENKIRRALRDHYGFTLNEANVYYAMVTEGISSVVQIAKSTMLKRSSVYLALEGLIEKNLARSVTRGKKIVYLPYNPRKLIESLDHKKAKLDEIVPYLEKEYLKQTTHTGKKAIARIYEEALGSKKRTLWFGSAKDMETDFPEYYEIMTNVRKYNKHFGGIRDVVGNTAADLKYARVQMAHKDPLIEVRTMPKPLACDDADNVIYNDKLAIISIKNDYFATIISDPTIVNAYRTIFELAWRSAEEVK